MIKAKLKTIQSCGVFIILRIFIFNHSSGRTDSVFVTSEALFVNLTLSVLIACQTHHHVMMDQRGSSELLTL